MTTRQTPDAVREAAWREIRSAWFDGRSAAKQYDSEAVEAKWDRQVARILAALDSRAGDAGEAFTGVEAWDELVNVDDRTSPEEYPDMCLITRDELIDFMERATPAPAVDAPVMIPREPTQAMRDAGLYHSSHDTERAAA